MTGADFLKKYGKLIIVLICLATAFLIFSCSNKSKKGNGTSDLKTDENVESVKEEKVYKTMEEFDEINKKGKTDETIDFVDKNIKIVGKENADILVYGLEEKLYSNINYRFRQLTNDDKDGELPGLFTENRIITEEDVKTIKNKELKKDIEDILKDKYTLVKNGDKLELVINYDKFLSYGESVSESTRDYLNIEAKILESPTIYNGEFNIEIDDLGSRLLKLETYLTEYPEAKHFEKILKYYRRDLISYLKGTESDLILDKNGKVNTRLFNSYKNLIKNKDSITANIVRKYVDILKDGNSFTRDDLEVTILSLTNQALNSIENKVE